MERNCSEALGDDFFEQILAVPSDYGGLRTVAGDDVGSMPMALQLGGSTSEATLTSTTSTSTNTSLGMGINNIMPLGLNLEQTAFLSHQHLRLNTNTTSSSSDNNMRPFFPAFGQLQQHPLRPTLLPSPQPQFHLHHHHHHHHQQAFQSQAPNPGPVAAMPQAPGIRPRVRARRGQATDPHSIAERLRRERIAERMKALQELVPSINKTDRAAMLDEIVDYVKFLRLQVKVLSMSRLGGAGAVAQLVADVPLSALEGEEGEGGGNEQAWEKWSNDGTEQQVAKLMEEDVGAAMQFLQSKALCIMPISLASAIFHMPHSSDPPTIIKPESNTTHS